MNAGMLSRLRSLARFGLHLACCALVCNIAQAQARYSPISEYEIKAAVLYKTAKFIEWPEQAFAKEAPAFVLCIVGSETVARAFATLERRSLQGRTLTVRRVIGDTLDLRQCQAVFFAASAEQDVDYALRGLASLPILTVGESRDFTQRGGALALTTQKNKIGFTVNLQASKRASLAVSAQLLQLATVVGAGAQ